MGTRSSNTQPLTRRSFLRGAAKSSAGVVIACQLPLSSGCTTKLSHSQPPNWEPNAWLQVTPANDIIFYLHRTEMGQGTLTGLTTLIAEELNTHPSLIKVKTSGIHPDYINPAYGVQITGGSTSISTNWDILRIAAATARDFLRHVAATRANATFDQCQPEDSYIVTPAKRFTFGELASEASKLTNSFLLTRSGEPQLTAKANYTYIGKYNQRLDSKMKAAGTATFGIDAGASVPYKAALLRCPVRGGKVISYDANDALASKGILKVVAIDNGIAAISESWWQAKEALKKITVNWEYPDLKNHSSDAIAHNFAQALQDNQGKKARKDGGGIDALKEAATQVHATYEVPYLAHATMEPMNCTVILKEDSCEVWAPTQGPHVVAALVEDVTSLRRSQITVHTTLMGGGFGRRLNQDYAVEATQIAKAAELPIQLIWTREDDTQNDFYRPAAMAQISAGLDSKGNLETWCYKSTSPNIQAYIFKEVVGEVLPAWLPDSLVRSTGSLGPSIYGGMLLDSSSVEGAQQYHYDTPNVEVRHVLYDPGLPCGFWRSVGHSFNGFFLESFMDELAHSAQQDPAAYRLKNLDNTPRLKKVLQVLMAKGSYGKPSKPGYTQGIAAYPSFGSYTAQLAEVTVERDEIKVHRVVCVIDCGTVINPDIVKMQMESGIIFGLTAALKGEITLKEGEVQQTNFHNYPLLRSNEVPNIEVHLIASDEAPTGVGEPGVPPIAAAVANAVFNATGKRLRKLPLRLS